MTARFALIGHPVSHSLSPAMQTAGLEALAAEDPRLAGASYHALDVAPEALRDAVRGLRALGYAGANVTVPFKAAVLAHLDRVEPEAAAIGAVNTLVREGDALVGTNTDAPGLVRALLDEGVALEGVPALVLGAGGAARAAVAGLARAGAARVVVAARREAEATRLVEALGPIAGRTPLVALPLARAPLAAELRGVRLVVQATSATLDDHDAGPRLAETLPFEHARPECCVVDLVYRPRETAVLRAARAAGLRAIDGTGMLVHQGALALSRWTGRPAPVAAMRAALERALASAR